MLATAIPMDAAQSAQELLRVVPPGPGAPRRDPPSIKAKSGRAPVQPCVYVQDEPTCVYFVRACGTLGGTTPEALAAVSAFVSPDNRRKVASGGGQGAGDGAGAGSQTEVPAELSQRLYLVAARYCGGVLVQRLPAATHGCVDTQLRVVGAATCVFRSHSRRRYESWCDCVWQLVLRDVPTDTHTCAAARGMELMTRIAVVRRDDGEWVAGPATSGGRPLLLCALEQLSVFLAVAVRSSAQPLTTSVARAAVSLGKALVAWQAANVAVAVDAASALQLEKLLAALYDGIAAQPSAVCKRKLATAVVWLSLPSTDADEALSSKLHVRCAACVYHVVLPWSHACVAANRIAFPACARHHCSPRPRMSH